MTTTEFTSFFVILLISLASAHARNVILLKNTAELTFLEDSISKESTLDPSQVEVPPLKGVAQDLFCNSCLEVSKRLEVILSDSTLLEKANMVLTDVCNLLPSDVQERCMEMSETYINQTITFIQVALSQKTLCYSTGLCSGSAKSVFIGEKEISDEGRCTKCHTAVAELRKELDNPETKMKLIRALLKACENVETHVKECKKIVFKYGPLILANLDEYMSNNDLCDMLHMCDSGTPLTIESSPIVQLIELPVTRHFRSTPTKMVM